MAAKTQQALENAMAKGEIRQSFIAAHVRHFLSGKAAADAERRDMVRSRAPSALASGDITLAEYEQVMETGEAPWVTEAKKRGEPL